MLVFFSLFRSSHYVRLVRDWELLSVVDPADRVSVFVGTWNSRERPDTCLDRKCDQCHVSPAHHVSLHVSGGLAGGGPHPSRLGQRLAGVAHILLSGGRVWTRDCHVSCVASHGQCQWPRQQEKVHLKQNLHYSTSHHQLLN